MNSLALFKPIRLFVFDMDGVLTDGRLLLMPDGEQLRSMNIKDGYAMKQAVDLGYGLIVISGSHSDPAVLRLNKLGIDAVFTRVEHKEKVLSDYLQGTSYASNEILYMGDDMPDLAAMRLCGLPCCPADACLDVQQAVKYRSPFQGGQGCVRDVIEKVLKLNQVWS